MGYNHPIAKSSLDLGQYPVFSTLGEKTLRALEETALTRHSPAGTYLSHAGDRFPYLFLVVEGSLKAIKESSEGRSLVATQLNKGDLFWGLAFFQEDLPNPVSFQFTSQSRVLLWARETILPLLLENGQLLWEITRLMVQRMLHASNIIEDLAFQPVSGRLAGLLLEDFKKTGEASISRNLTLDEMAARVGTTREMVCRVLYRFADQNLIDVTRTEFVLKNKPGLERLRETA